MTKHHKAIAPFEAVQEARAMYIPHYFGYTSIAKKLSEKYGVYIGTSTVRDWIHELRFAA